MVRSADEAAARKQWAIAIKRYSDALVVNDEEPVREEIGAVRSEHKKQAMSKFAHILAKKLGTTVPE